MYRPRWCYYCGNAWYHCICTDGSNQYLEDSDPDETDSENENEDSNTKPRDDEEGGRTDDPVADGEVSFRVFPAVALSPSDGSLTQVSITGDVNTPLELTIEDAGDKQVKLPVFKPDLPYNGYDGWVNPVDSVYVRFRVPTGTTYTVSVPAPFTSNVVIVPEGANDVHTVYINNIGWPDVTAGYFEIPVTVNPLVGTNREVNFLDFQTFGVPSLTSNFNDAFQFFTPNDPNNNWPFPTVNGGVDLRWNFAGSSFDVRYIGNFTSLFPISWFGFGSGHIEDELEPFTPQTRSNILSTPIEISWGTSGTGKAVQTGYPTGGNVIYLCGSNGTSELIKVHYWNV